MIKLKHITPEEYIKMSRSEAEHAVAKVMEKFDFSRASDALKACGWKYQGATESPTATDLREIGRRLLMQCIQSGADRSIMQGPLTVVTRCYGTPEVVTVELILTPIWASEVYIDARSVLAKQMRKQIARKVTG